jgi:aspartate kinase
MAENKNKKIKKVIKFGGSCLKSAASLKQAASIIKSEPDRVAVVVSAASGVTNLLLDAYHYSLTQGKTFRGVLAQIKKLHTLLASETLSLKRFRELQAKFEEFFITLEKTLQGILLIRETSPSLKARILSTGERLSAYLLASVLEESGLKARVYETDRCGLITDEESEKAEINLEKFDLAFKKTAEEIDAGSFTPLFTGFFGCNLEGKVVLFGRNGSDYTAAVIARGLRAPVLETYKDVPGFLTADPQVAPKARLITRISPEEAAELSYFGARILHPKIWQPLEGLKVAVVIKSFYHPENPGTIISSRGYKSEKVVKSFSLNQNIAVLRVEGPAVGDKPGVIGKIGSALAEKGINILTVLTSQTCINLILNTNQADPARELLFNIKEVAIRNVQVEKELALVACVGKGIRETPGIAGRIFSVLAREGINLEFFSSGASDVAIYLIVKKDDSCRAVQALHGEYFEGSCHPKAEWEKS